MSKTASIKPTKEDLKNFASDFIPVTAFYAVVFFIIKSLPVEYLPYFAIFLFLKVIYSIFLSPLGITPSKKIQDFVFNTKQFFYRKITGKKLVYCRVYDLGTHSWIDLHSKKEYENFSISYRKGIPEKKTDHELFFTKINQAKK